MMPYLPIAVLHCLHRELKDDVADRREPMPGRMCLDPLGLAEIKLSFGPRRWDIVAWLSRHGRPAVARQRRRTA